MEHEREMQENSHNSLAGNIFSLHTLVKKLQAMNSRLDYCSKLFKNCQLSPQELKPYYNFNDHSYTRNLIYKDSHFELMLLCWSPGAETELHNHNASKAWVTCLSGEIEEIIYSSQFSGSFPRLRSRTISRRSNSYIDDNLGLHKLVNRCKEKAVTLHCYSPPVESCQIYNLETGVSQTKYLSYHSTKERIDSVNMISKKPQQKEKEKSHE